MPVNRALPAHAKPCGHNMDNICLTHGPTAHNAVLQRIKRELPAPPTWSAVCSLQSPLPISTFDFRLYLQTLPPRRLCRALSARQRSMLNERYTSNGKVESRKRRVKSKAESRNGEWEKTAGYHRQSSSFCAILNATASTSRQSCQRTARCLYSARATKSR